MIESDDAFMQRLLAMFAAEAHGQLDDIGAALRALEQGAGAARADAILKALHTLKGAARSVELHDLEWLCHALEGVFAAGARPGAGFCPEQFALLHETLGVARLLTAAPGGRTRNQAMALAGQLDLLARELADGATVPH